MASPYIVAFPVLAAAAALVIRLARAAYNMTWKDLGHHLGVALSALVDIFRPRSVIRRIQGLGRVDWREVGRRLRRAAARSVTLVALALLITVASVAVYATAFVLMVTVEIPLIVIGVLSRKLTPRDVGGFYFESLIKLPQELAASTWSRYLGGSPRRKKNQQVGDDSVDSQVINFFIRDVSAGPDAWLVVGETYTGVVQVGAPLPENLAEGDRTILRSDIPAGGLMTEWTMWSTSVNLASGLDALVKTDTVTAGTETQWMARFTLLIPPDGESEQRSIRLSPMAAGQCRIDGIVRVAGDIYREITVHLRAQPPSGDDDVEHTGDGPGPEALGMRRADLERLKTRVRRATAPAVTAEQLLVVPARHLAPRTYAAWKASHRTLNLTFLPPMVQIRSEELGPDDAEAWTPDIAGLETLIAATRRALDDVRAGYQADFDDIEPHRLRERLARFRPSDQWLRTADHPDPAVNERWTKLSRSPELAQLAYEGHALFQEVFPRRSRLRETLDLLEHGDRLDITWQQNGVPWVPHVPWGLMYRSEPPVAGDAVNIDDFLALRYRISYRAYRMGIRSRAVNQGATRAHLLYWGGQSDDETWTESVRHADELARWRPLVLPRSAEKKRELSRFLHDPEPRPVGLLYLYCKCTIEPTAEPVLRFGSTNASDDVLQLRDLGTRPFGDQPLVFANACDTAVSRPYTPNRLEKLFFDRECRAFIGTECKVPVQLAARFATVFFHFLYDDSLGPLCAGEALVQARRFLWDEYRNMGGLFYCYTNDYFVHVASDAQVSALSVTTADRIG